MSTEDIIERPKHYTSHPSGIECIQITEHMGFNLGNAMKYIWRCDLKKDAVEDLKKAKWYIEREINKRTGKKMEDPLPAVKHECATCRFYARWGSEEPCCRCNDENDQWEEAL